MGIINVIRTNKIKRTLALVGYNDEQINKIISVITDASLLYFTDTLLDDKQIDECIKFLSYGDAVLMSYAVNLPFENRVIIIKLFIKLKEEKLGINVTKTFRLLYDIACNYDSRVLQYAIDNIFQTEINYQFLNDLSNAYGNGKNLYEKFSIPTTDKVK